MRTTSPALILLTMLPMTAATRWPLWESYAASFLDSQGRIVQRDEQDKTTSEAQAYAMFFALVANDRPRFEQLLTWTQNNLAGGDLSARLPAWHWGRSSSGTWTVQDDNSASDADLWMAFTLLEAGKQWEEPRFSTLGSRLARTIAELEVTYIPGLGPMLLPGARGFRTGKDRFFLNPSYVPVQVLRGLAVHQDDGPWSAIAASIPRLIRDSSPHGFALDWVAYRAGKGFSFEAPASKKALASYDAIRVYLWAGMLPPENSRAVLESLGGMARYLKKHAVPPSEVGADGKVRNSKSGVGFSAALIPYLTALGESAALISQQQRLNAARDEATGLYADGRYYDQNLTLFSTGWSEGRYSFAADGTLRLGWR